MSFQAIPPDQLEKYSSAMTLSDMEIFMFPELLYGLVLANIMSPKLWAWRNDAWFAKLDKMTPYRRILRLKQFIIDHYEFNLDLDTWGLTTKERELERFKPWMTEDTVALSNALFGYEGDKYYFELDIRRHFGLDKYNTNIIPYWKTETLEAMDAFRFKDGYSTGAGECVSLSTLYAAAMFVVCGIPLRDIFLMATPLHSQNFIDTADGVLTNNRRVVSKNMWFNGTELTEKAQRALRHEQVTIVAHHTGHIHVVYPEATIEPAAYDRFRQRLKAFLTTDINMEILANYLRQNSSLQKCFQVVHHFSGKPRYIEAEKVYAYEHSSSYKVSDSTRDKLLEEIDEDEFFAEMIDGRIPLNKFEDFFRQHTIDLDLEADVQLLMKEFNCYNARACDIIKDIIRFTRLEPRLPGGDKKLVAGEPIELAPEMSREEIIARLEAQRAGHPVVDLAFYCFRDLARTDWAPFLKAALERSPVSAKGAEGKTDEQVIEYLAGLPNESIYDGARTAQPDEVWNYQRGDGLERAICLASIWKARHPGDAVTVRSQGGQVSITLGGRSLSWPSSKGLEKELTL
ncbi:MAG: hypothetical protein V1873_04835 [Verrucomicrobiota bacterium]